MSPASEIRLVLADVDGTLVTDEKVVTERASAAVRALRDAGVAFTLTSSRPPAGLKRLIAALGLTEPIAGFNGGLLVDPALRVLERRPLEAEAAQMAAQMITALGLDLWVYTEEDWCVPAANGPHVRNEAWILGLEPLVVQGSFAPHLDKAFKIVGVSDDHDRVRRCEGEAKARLRERASAERSEPHFLDVTNPRATKGDVVRTLSAQLGLRPSQVAAIGDMPNDVLMFEVSGLSIAMGNASDAVKARASWSTASNEDEGFARAMERLLAERRGAGASNAAEPIASS